MQDRSTYVGVADSGHPRGVKYIPRRKEALLIFCVLASIVGSTSRSTSLFDFWFAFCKGSLIFFFFVNERTFKLTVEAPTKVAIIDSSFSQTITLLVGSTIHNNRVRNGLAEDPSFIPALTNNTFRAYPSPLPAAYTSRCTRSC